MIQHSYLGCQFTETSGIYSNNMCIKGKFSTSVPLMPDSSYDKTHFLSDPQFSFSFSDGVNTYANDDPHTDITEHGGFEFSITTDTNGMPKLWFIFIRRPAPPGEDKSSTMSTAKDNRPASFDEAMTEQLSEQDSQIIGNGKVYSEGTWTMGLNPPQGFRIEQEVAQTH